MILAPYRRAAFTASVIVASSVTPMTVTTSAPAFAAISTSRAPVSMTLRSATIVLPGQAFRRARTDSTPSDFTRGVPASIQSAPPATASFAAWTARLRCMKSRATCRTGSMGTAANLPLPIKTYRTSPSARGPTRTSRGAGAPNDPGQSGPKAGTPIPDWRRPPSTPSREPAPGARIRGSDARSPGSSAMSAGTAPSDSSSSGRGTGTRSLGSPGPRAAFSAASRRPAPSGARVLRVDTRRVALI